MSRLIKLAIAVAASAGYVFVLRYLAPSHEPYFILGFALIGIIAWLYGMVAGVTAALLLIPATQYIYEQFALSKSYLSFAMSPVYIALEVLTAAVLSRLRQTHMALSTKEAILAEANDKLQNALSQVRELGGVHCICSSCKQILSDNGKWMKIDTYLTEKSKMEFSHGMCPDCATSYQSQPAESE